MILERKKLGNEKKIEKNREFYGIIKKTTKEWAIPLFLLRRKYGYRKED